MGAGKPCRVRKGFCSLPFLGWFLFPTESSLRLPVGVPPWGRRAGALFGSQAMGIGGVKWGGAPWGWYPWGNCGDFKNKCFLLTLSHADVEVGQAGDSALVPTVQRWQAASGLRPHRARVHAVERVVVGRPGHCRPLGTACPSLMEMGPSQESRQSQGEVSVAGTA